MTTTEAVETMTDVDQARAWMEKLDKLINDKNLTHPRVFYTWRECRETVEICLSKLDVADQELKRKARYLLETFDREKACPECGTVMPPCTHIVQARTLLAAGLSKENT